MPNESFIDRIEQQLSDMARLGGQAEQTRIVTNVTVIDASPSDVTGRVIVQDPRDGDYVPALKIPGIVYNNNDLVNVLFVEGTEPIAFQQGSGSSTATGLWQLEGGTGPDIFYNLGNVAISDNLEHDGDADTFLAFTADAIDFQAGGISLLTLTETTQDLVEIGDNAGGGDVDVNFNSGQVFIQGSNGQLGIATTSFSSTDETLAIQGQAANNNIVSLYTGDGDGGDFNSLTIYGVGTPGSITNRERLILQYRSTGPDWRILSEAQGTGTLRDIVIETEGNSDQVYIATDGNTGFGTNSPFDRIHAVDSSGNKEFFTLFAAAGQSSIASKINESTGNSVRWVGTVAAANPTSSNIIADFKVDIIDSDPNALQGAFTIRTNRGDSVQTSMYLDEQGRVGIPTTSPAAILHVDQSSTTAAIPVLTLDQADLSEEYIDFVTASTGSGDPVDTATAVGTAYARLRVAVNGTFKYIQLYNA